MKPQSVKERFYKGFSKASPDQCWEWQKAKTTAGYGNLGGTTKGKRYMLYAHRLSYSFHIGKIPKHAHVLHSCNNPACVNPNHLYLGTNQDNIDYKVACERQWPPRKFSKEQASEIRKLYANKVYSMDKLASLFSVSRGTIKNIIRLKTYKD